MFYNEWTPSRESLVSKLAGTFVPKWDDIQDDPKPNLRELLLQKRKIKEAPTLKLDSTPQCVRVYAIDGRMIYKL